jgi:transposase
MVRKGAGGFPIGSRSTTMVLSLDVSKDELVCTLLDRSTRQPRWEPTVPNTPAGVRRLLAKTPADAVWVLEPTGSYSLPVVKQAQAAGRTVLMADPKKARRYLQSLNTRAKTDRIDSRGLALFALDRELRPYPVKSAALEQVDQLLTARKGMADAISRLRQQMKELPHAADLLQEAVEELQKRQRRLDRQIEQLTRQEPTLSAVARLRAVPGIGLITATTAVSRLAARRFARPEEWVAYIGYDIAIRQSGKRNGELGLSKQGDAELRRLFYLCAQSSLNARESPFAGQYEREKKKGLKTTAALCAVARKLARVAWSLFHHGTNYDAARVYRAQPA